MQKNSSIKSSPALLSSVAKPLAAEIIYSKPSLNTNENISSLAQPFKKAFLASAAQLMRKILPNLA